MIDDELDYWPMSMWTDPANADRFADELCEATGMDDDEIVACLAWLHDPAHKFPDGQYIGEAIEALFQDHMVAAYTSWAQFASLWADNQGGGQQVLNALIRVARSTGNQDVFFEILAQLGEETAETEGSRFWWFHVATLLDGRVFCMEHPTPPSPTP